MAEEENQASLNKIKSTNFPININFMGSTHFQNEELERHFKKKNQKEETFHERQANSMIALGYLSYGLYLYLVFFRDILFITNILCFVLSIVIYLSLAYSKKIGVSKFYTDQILILISYLNTLGKVYYVIFMMENKQEEHSTEILRCLFYSFLSTYLYILMKIENCFYTYSFYMTTHLFVAYFSDIYSKGDHFYYVEWAFGTMLGFIFLYFRKIWEVKKRFGYAEKKRFDLVYEFAQGLLRNSNSKLVGTENSEILYETKIN